MEFFHGLKIALMVESLVGCLIVAGWFAYHSQTVIGF